MIQDVHKHQVPLSRRFNNLPCLRNSSGSAFMVELGGAEARHLSLRRDHRLGDCSPHLLLRSKLASWRACGRVLRYSAQQQDGTSHHLSIWDTSPQLKPKVTAADPKTLHNRFGGEGTGAHTHMIWDWGLGETFQFFIEKLPGKRLISPKLTIMFTTAPTKSGFTVPRSPAPMAESRV